jgi:hypothetical protein
MKKIFSIILVLISLIAFAQRQEKKIDTVSQMKYKSFSFVGKFSVIDEENKRFSMLNMKTGETKKSVVVKSSQPRVPNFPITFVILYYLVVTHFLSKKEGTLLFLLASTAVALAFVIITNIFKIFALHGDVLLMLFPIGISALSTLLVLVTSRKPQKPHKPNVVFWTLFWLTLVVGALTFFLKGTLILLIPPLFGLIAGRLSWKN